MKHTAEIQKRIRLWITGLQKERVQGSHLLCLFGRIPDADSQESNGQLRVLITVRTEHLSNLGTGAIASDQESTRRRAGVRKMGGDGVSVCGEGSKVFGPLIKLVPLK